MDCWQSDASTDDDDYYEWLRAPDSDEDVLPDDDDRAAPEPLEHRLSTGSATNEVAAVADAALAGGPADGRRPRPRRRLDSDARREAAPDEQRRLRVAAAVAALGRQ
jgi:hypothetical protein